MGQSNAELVSLCQGSDIAALIVFRRGDHGQTLSQIQLFLVDEVIFAVSSL